MRTCDGCRYYFSAGGISSCRALPPRIEADFANERVHTYFPQPSPEMWCGLHKIAWGRLIARLLTGNGT